MFFDYIFGRLIAYVENDNMLKDEETAKFYACAGEDADIIIYRPDDPLQRRSIIHEELHATLDRTGIGLQISEDLEENICEALSIFIDETYELKRKRDL